jgi:hypothetical protein
MILALLALLILVWCIELAGYFFLTPDQARPPLHERPLLKHAGTLAYGIAYVLSLLRAPLGLLPYLVKLWLHLGLKIRYEARRTTYARELLNMCSEIANLILTWELVRLIVGPARLQELVILCYLPVWAESVRLLAERIPILFSAAWQLIPHRQIARFLQRHVGRLRSWRVVQRYCRYYSLSDAERAVYALAALKRKAADDPEVADRLAYLRAFRIVPQQQGLRGGLVRDVAQGEVFIHGIWTSDPWLLAGMALRRSPWSFDPCYLQRPFYYMSGANRAMSLFVLRHARYSLPYALFQFGHEIRVARLHCFYMLLRWLGADTERKVWADGTFQNDQCIFWLKHRLTHDAPLTEPHALYSDEEVLAELAHTIASNTRLSVSEIAARYVYPQKYVEEVLLPQFMHIQEETLYESPISHPFTKHA